VVTEGVSKQTMRDDDEGQLRAGRGTVPGPLDGHPARFASDDEWPRRLRTGRPDLPADLRPLRVSGNQDFSKPGGSCRGREQSYAAQDQQRVRVEERATRGHRSVHLEGASFFASIICATILQPLARHGRGPPTRSGLTMRQSESIDEPFEARREIPRPAWATRSTRCRIR
jgi:hypothetical protein